MSKDIKFKQETREIDGIEYVFQNPGIEEVLKIRSRALNSGGESQFVLYKEWLDNVVVKPRKELSDFKSLAALDRLMNEVENFIYGEEEEGKSEGSKEK